ncbi:MAG TPA: hypothetical protein VG186_13885 [Solirubrobacteraceae bacterium]|jgi:hypothetical protein|nr:hypothetical protein [Solirubrobacteraceae bacterium]
MSVFAIAPALPLHSAGKYVAGAYIVFVVVILVYVMIMAVRLSRTERALVELGRDIARRDEGEPETLAAAAAGPGAGERPPELDREPAPAGRPGDTPL